MDYLPSINIDEFSTSFIIKYNYELHCNAFEKKANWAREAKNNISLLEGLRWPRNF